MRSAAVITLLCLLPVSGGAEVQSQTRKAAARKKGGTKTTATAGTRKSTAAAKPAAAARKSTGKRSRTALKSRNRQSWRARQTAPTAERYRQIQEALAAKGYLHSQPSGVWNSESSDALRRFQSEQNLEATGKVNSLSLMALGLGPKRETAPALAAPPATAVVPVPPR